jgi:hypothetical protein
MATTDYDSNCTESTKWTECSESHEAKRSERRLDIAATLLARGVRRVLGADLTPEHGAVERENDALPVRATEAVMGAASNQEKTTR